MNETPFFNGSWHLSLISSAPFQRGAPHSISQPQCKPAWNINRTSGSGGAAKLTHPAQEQAIWFQLAKVRLASPRVQVFRILLVHNGPARRASVNSAPLASRAGGI